jgi:hypothetical protein
MDDSPSVTVDEVSEYDSSGSSSDGNGLGNNEFFDQNHEEIVLGRTWWWAVHLSLSTVALIANLIFIVTVIYNRKRHDLQTFVTALITAIAFLDILDVLRVLPVLVEQVFLEEIFRHVFCSFGVFHELAVAIFLVSLSIAICVQAGKESKFYQSTGVSLVHKILIPVVLLVSAGAAGPFFLLPYEKLSHTCTDPFRVMHVLETDSEKFPIDLYSTFITVFTYVLPLLIVPLAIPIATLRTCMGKQCCVPRFKQPIGELIMVSIVTMIYIGTVIGIVLPRLDKLLQLEAVDLGPAPLLWELGNDAVRPLIYFMTNPAVWEGLRILCCRRKNRLVDEDDEEIEVPLSPVTTV